MNQTQIRDLIESRMSQDGLVETGVPGVRIFRATQAVPCAPAIYEPSVVAIASGTKEAVLDGERFVYDNRRYLCCPMSMPVMAGTPNASPEDPLFGVLVSLDPRVMTDLAIEMEAAGDEILAGNGARGAQGIRLAEWDNVFADALLRVLLLGQSRMDTAILGSTRLRELYFAILKGEAGRFARQAFAPGNAIVRSIAQVSADLGAPISIDEMAARAGMSRAVFHRKFKHATRMSPIQFVKAMRLNSAAMKISGGMTVNAAALDVGYVSASQFSREFKRLYGRSPRRWGEAQHLQPELAGPTRRTGAKRETRPRAPSG